MVMRSTPMPPPLSSTSPLCPTAHYPAPPYRRYQQERTKAVFGSTPVKAGYRPFTRQHPAIVFQIGTAKYGVRDQDGNLDPAKVTELAANPAVKMFEIKLSQGAKPGKGGILPGEKVTEVIASTRGIPNVGQDSISPNRHPDVTDADSLLDLIAKVREASGKPTGIKFVVGQTQWLEDLFGAIHARGIASAPDFFTLDSADGGTGAAPQGLMDNMGLPRRFKPSGHS